MQIVFKDPEEPDVAWNVSISVASVMAGKSPHLDPRGDIGRAWDEWKNNSGDVELHEWIEHMVWVALRRTESKGEFGGNIKYDDGSDTEPHTHE